MNRFVSAIIVVISSQLQAVASTRYVDYSTGGSGIDSPTSGQNLITPYLTIQYALDQNYPDNDVTIWVKKGNRPYTETAYGYLYLKNNLDAKDVSIIGYNQSPGDNPSIADSPWLDAIDSNRVIWGVSNTNLTLKYFQATGPNLVAVGSIIQWTSTGNLHVQFCTIGQPTATAIGIYAPNGCGVNRRIAFLDSTMNCKYIGLSVSSAGSLQVQRNIITSYSTFNGSSIILVRGTIGNPNDQTIRSIITDNLLQTHSSTSSAELSGVVSENCDFAKRFEVSRNTLVIRSHGNCIAATNCTPTIVIDSNECYSVNESWTGTQIRIGTDATPQLPVSNVNYKSDRGNIIIANNLLEQTNTIFPNPNIVSGHCILLGQGADGAVAKNNVGRGFDAGIVVKAENCHVAHNRMYGGAPLVIKGGQHAVVEFNTFVHNQHPSSSGCFDIQDKSDAASGLQQYHLSRACSNYITNNILVVEPGFNDFCINDNMVGGFHPLSEDNYLDNNLYYAPSAAFFSFMNGAVRTTFADHVAVWPAYSEMFPNNDENSLYGDPLLVSPQTGDFRIPVNSPAYHHGSIGQSNMGAEQGAYDVPLKCCAGDLNGDLIIDGLDIQELVNALLEGEACK